MLGRLVYLLILLAVILAGGFALNFLAHGEGQLVLHYGERIYSVTLLEGAILVVLLIIAVLVALWLLRLAIALVRFIAGDETAFGYFFVHARERRGLNALTEAQMALATGDAKHATRSAQKAERRLQRPDLTRIVNAQAAELAGDETRARKYYRALLLDPKTAFVGTRGLLKLALKNGDTERALKLAEHARQLKPKDAENLETLYLLQSQAFDWGAARKTLAVQVKAGQLPPPEAHRRESALALAQSEDAAGAGDSAQARTRALEAARLDLTNTAAVTTAVGLLIEAGEKRQATKLVTEAWKAAPRPQLAASFAAIEPDEAPAARRRRFEKLFAIHPDHAETQFLRAELALAARDWTGAQAAIGDLRETEPSARSCAIMAAIARGRGEPDHIVRAWLARALGAPRDEAAEVFISQSAMLPLLIEGDEAEAEPAPETGATGSEAAQDAEEATATEMAEDAEEPGPPPRDLEGSEEPRPAGKPGRAA